MIDWGRLWADRRALAAVIAVPLVLLAGLGTWLLVAGPDPDPTPSPTATASLTATPSPTPQPAALDDGRLTILVLGSDSNTVRRARGKAYLTDAITVMSVDGRGRTAALVSLPRDTVDLPLPGGGTWTSKVNSIAVLRGPEVARDTMSLLLGIPIDHYLMVDMDDFSRIVDAVGGVTVTVPYTLTDKRCSIPAGTQTLGGEQALCFARHRTVDSDYARAGRHQQLLLALRDAILARQVDLATLADGLTSLQTDVPLEDVPAYADLLRRSADAEVNTLLLTPPKYTTFVGMAGSRGWISVPNVPAIQTAVTALLR